MHDRNAAQKLEEAITATESFVAILTAEELPGWAGRFSSIAALLRDGDISAAKQHFGNLSYTGPGSLSDIYAKDESAFYRALGRCARSIRALAEA